MTAGDAFRLSLALLAAMAAAPVFAKPKAPIAVPWESCVTIGQRWGYAYDGEYKSVRTKDWAYTVSRDGSSVSLIRRG